MLTRRTPMKSTAFKPRAPQWAQRDQDRVRSMPTVTPGAFREPQPVVAAPGAQVHKAAPVRSEAYRRAVATLPCAICGVAGHSQAAHGSDGKGMGLKACDLTCFPACAPRVGAVGCHAGLDQGALFTKAARRELEPVWAADTRRRVKAMGLWPARLPYPDDG